MKKCRNLIKFSLLKCSNMMLVSKNRNDVISIYGSDESSSSTAKLHRSLNHYTFCFFRLSCSAVYVNFSQLILKNKLFRVVFRLCSIYLEMIDFFVKFHIEMQEVQNLIAKYNMINHKIIEILD